VSQQDHEKTRVSDQAEGDVEKVQDDAVAVGNPPDLDSTDEDSTDGDATVVDATDGVATDGVATDGDSTDEADIASDPSESEGAGDAGGSKRRVGWMRVVAYGVLPGLVLILALGAGYLKYVDTSLRSSDLARIESMQAAKDGTIAILSYTPDKVEQQLGDARNLLTGEFQNSYTTLTNDVVIPGAKQKQISATATVPSMASVSADPRHAVVLVFVNQATTVGADKPSDSASSVRVTLDKVDEKWLISGFDPV
jgi:Mce-associated membrane protein